MTKQEIDFETDEPLAVFEATALTGWTWEVYEVTERSAHVVTAPGETDDDPETAKTALYFGRVKSPLTFGAWEIGSFSAWQLENVGAERVDADTDEWP